MAANARTFTAIAIKKFESYIDSTRYDVVGPIELDPLANVPKLTVPQKKEYYGSARLVMASGKADKDDDIDSESDDDDDADAEPKQASDLVPISYHVLPAQVVLDFCQAYNVKHVLDITPSPMELAPKLIERGISYLGVCGTEFQKSYLQKQMRNSISKGLVDPNNRLFDARFGDVVPKGLQVVEEDDAENLNSDDDKVPDAEGKAGDDEIKKGEKQPKKGASAGKVKKEKVEKGASAEKEKTVPKQEKPGGGVPGNLCFPKDFQQFWS